MLNGIITHLEAKLSGALPVAFADICPSVRGTLQRICPSPKILSDFNVAFYWVKQPHSWKVGCEPNAVSALLASGFSSFLYFSFSFWMNSVVKLVAYYSRMKKHRTLFVKSSAVRSWSRNSSHRLVGLPRADHSEQSIDRVDRYCYSENHTENVSFWVTS